MVVEISAQERDILRHLVEREIADTGPEVRHTNTSSYREELKDYKRTLRELYDRLGNNV